MSGPRIGGRLGAALPRVGSAGGGFSRRTLLQGISIGVGAGVASILNAGRTPASAAPYAMIDVLRYGVLGDGASDDRNAIQAIISTFGGLRPIYFPAGRYRIGTANTKGPNRITLPSGTHLSFAKGAVIEVNAADHQPGSAILFGGGTDGTKTRLTGPATVGQAFVALPAGETARLVAGDVVGFESDGSAGEFDPGPWRVREFHSITSINGDTVFLDNPLEYSYTVPDGAVFWKVETVKDITIDGAVFECGPGVNPDRDGTYSIRLTKVENFLLTNVTVRNMIGGIAIHDSYRGNVRDCTIDGLPRYGDAYGYGVHVGGSSAKINVDNLRGSGNRHLFTTLADVRGGTFWGGPMYIKVNNGIGYGAPKGYSIWDTHEFGRHIEFNNCVAMEGGSAVSGFQMRAQDIVLNNCRAQANGLRAVVLTASSRRVHVNGGDFGSAGTQGIAAAGESHRIVGAHVHDCVGAGIALLNSKDVLIQGGSVINNLYGLQDGGRDDPANTTIKASVNAKIRDCIIPASAKQVVSIANLSTTAVAENLLCLGYKSMGGLFDNATDRWGAPSGATYSIMTSDGWISNPT